jgi:diaminopimelate epimerase
MNGAAPLRFAKMHGAGNDFVVIDLRGREPPSPREIAALADRHTGIGFDQLLGIEAPSSPDAVADYRIWNADGSTAGQCGNGARCIAAWLRREGVATAPRYRLGSPSGPVDVEALADGRFAIGMGVPAFAPTRVPFRAPAEADRYALPLADGTVHFGAVSMGNPHAVIEVPSAADADVGGIAPALQSRPEFPDGVNVGFAQVLATDRIRLRVYERGAGETLACGSGACAAVAVLVRQGRVGRDVAVELPGGTLRIAWPADDAPVTMAGPAAFVFDGVLAA